jgi:outer membrane protein OmpA-like peptidoglycan-associated protein
VLTNPQFTSTTYSTGVEAGMIVAKNLRLGLGFNFAGFFDRDLSGMDYTTPGAYMGLAYKFDERQVNKLLKRPTENPALYFECEPNLCEQVAVLNLPLHEAKLEMAEIKPRDLILDPFLPQSIHFGLDKHNISLASAPFVDQIADFMLKNKKYDLKVVGHTDSRSSSAYNERLSRRRAEGTKAYLIASGVEADRIEILAQGEDSLRISNEASVTHESENRRVEFYLIPQDRRIRMIPVYEDLQVERKALPYSRNWDFLIQSKFDVVPNRINFNDESSKMTKINELIVKRITTVMNAHPDVNLRIEAPFASTADKFVASARVKNVVQALFDGGVEIDRMSSEIVSLNEVDKPGQDRESKLRSLYFIFENGEKLSIVEQQEDLVGAAAEEVPAAVDRMLEIQTTRKDREVLDAKREVAILPGAVHFAWGMSKLDHKSQGVLSRVGQYLSTHPGVRLELTGIMDSNSSSNRRITESRMENVMTYLVEIGVNPSQVYLGDTKVDRSGTSSTKRRVEFKFVSEDEIRTFKQDYDVKP